MHSPSEAGRANLKVAFFLNLSFTLLEIVGGLLTNSVAVLSDALHDLGDSFSLALAWWLEGYADKASDQRYSYGYHRFSLLGAVINAALLLGGSLIILAETIPRFSHPEAFSAPGLIVFAVIGVAANGLAVLRLRGSESANIQVVGWHLLEDVLGWAAVLMVGIISLFVDAPILDPLLSVLITIYVLTNVVRNLRRTARLFLQAVPGGVDLAQLQDRLLAIDGVQSVHHLHLWSLDGQRSVFTAHLVIPAEAEKGDIIRIKQAADRVLSDLPLEHVTLETEYPDEHRSPNYHR